MVVLLVLAAALASGGPKPPAAPDRVAVAFRATGGTVTPSGLFTSGRRSGTYRVLAISGRVADTVVITLSPPPPSALAGSTPQAPPHPPGPPPASAPKAAAARSSARLGIPFGPSGLPKGIAATAPFSLAMQGVTPGNIIAALRNAHAAGSRLLLNLTGGSHDNYLTLGVFDRSKWEAKLSGYNRPDIQSAIAGSVADGTLVGASVMDEPHVSGQGDGNTWGPPGTMTKARVDSLCADVKTMFPTLPVGVVHRHDVFEPDRSYRVCEFLVSQYSSRIGDVTAFRNSGLALARRDGMAILFSMNILNGGTQAPRASLWECPSGITGGRGTRAPNCRITPQQIRDYGMVLGPAGCGFLMWRYDPDFMDQPENQAAFADLAQRLASLPVRSCTRQ